MVPGVTGLTGPSVPRLVVEELRPGRDSVINQLQHMVVKTVMVGTLKRDSVTLTPALFQVNNHNNLDTEPFSDI